MEQQGESKLKQEITKFSTGMKGVLGEVTTKHR